MTDRPSSSHDPDRPYWEGIYAEHGTNQSGRPNASMVAEAGPLSPGRALDAGCGEGADAIWLAERGWQVTAVDFVETALEHARERTASLERDIAARLTWEQRDLAHWAPPASAYDLVTSHFVHLPAAQLASLFERLAAAVAPGGTLLVVGHDHAELESGPPRGESPDLYLSTEFVARALDPEHWQVEVAETRPRPGHGHGHGHGSDLDSVLRARRLR